MRQQTFPEMWKVVPEGEHGVAKVDHFEVDESASRWSAMGGGRDWVPAGKYARLRVRNQVVMSDTS